MSAFTEGGMIYPFRAADTGRWTWATGEPLIWQVRGISQNFTIVVPPGFYTDLGTIPWFGRIFINPADPQLVKAFILHDYILAEYGPACQPFAASQLYESLRALDASPRLRKVIVAAVVAAIDDW